MKSKQKIIFRLYGAAVLTGLMLSFSWIPYKFSPLIFFAFTPLLWAEDYLYKNKEFDKPFRFFFISYLSFLIWNVICTYWIFYSTPAGILANNINTLFMAIAMSLIHFCRKALFKNASFLLLLLLFWTAFEYGHKNWEISWPWLDLGNVFANNPQWIQWYEYTGTAGGSIWVLSSSYLFLKWVQAMLSPMASKRKKQVLGLGLASLILIPISISYAIYARYKPQGERVHIAAVQPNIDPYGEQYNIQPEEASQKMLELAEMAIHHKTALVVTPESMIQEYVWENSIDSSPSVLLIKNFLKNYPESAVLAGLSSYTLAKESEKEDPEVRSHPYGEFYYRAHNTAALIETDSIKQVYHKSKLTPGVEIMPYAKYLKFIQNWAIDLGGTVGTLGIDKERKVFTTAQGLRFAPIICYESIYGEFVSEYAKNGAQILCIITNDGWWKDSPGHKQHLAYARLRAIETRRDIVRSANTGISCFINQRGDISQTTKYWTEDVISTKLHKNDRITFYSRYGDIAGRVSFAASLACILLSLIYGIFIPKQPKLNKEK